jgi:hypothetical protein
MIKYDNIISQNSIEYFQIIEKYYPELIEYGSIVSQENEMPYIEEP